MEGLLMAVKRIVTNLAADKPESAATFYWDVLGLELLMDHGWIQTYGNAETTTVQVSIASEGGSGTPVPDLSIEVDNLDEIIARIHAAGIALEYGVAEESWGVRRFFVRDPLGNLVNILQHV